MHHPCSSRWLLRSLVLVLGLGLASIRAQSTAVSNRGQAFNAFLIADATFADAIDFTTGGAVSTLDSFTLPIKSFGGSPAGFSLSLYSGLSGGGSGTLVTTLTGTTPSALADYVFAPPVTTSLAANSTYFLVLTGLSSGASSGYHWSAAATTNDDSGAMAGWSIGNLRWISSNGGATWGTAIGVVPQFSVSVTAVPEPSTFAVLAGCAGLFAAWRLRRGCGRASG
jgi:hypothetical protein